jgi:hypothetical protein
LFGNPLNQDLKHIERRTQLLGEVHANALRIQNQTRQSQLGDGLFRHHRKLGDHFHPGRFFRPQLVKERLFAKNALLNAIQVSSYQSFSLLAHQLQELPMETDQLLKTLMNLDKLLFQRAILLIALRLESQD